MPAIPPAMNLGDLPVAIVSKMFDEPREGRRSITQVIDWSRPIAQGLAAISVNMQNNATLEFSQICGLIVDNSECGSDLDFIFPDTDITISIPAYSPYIVLDVATNQTQFFVVAQGAIGGDVTRFSILNFAPPPIAVPTVTQQLVANTSSIVINGNSTTPLIAAGTNGTLQGINVNVTAPTPTNAFNVNLLVRDGSLRTLWTGNVAQNNSGAGFVAALVDLSRLSIRFENGINLVQTGGPVVTGGAVDTNLYYKTP